VGGVGKKEGGLTEFGGAAPVSPPPKLRLCINNVNMYL